MLDITAFSATFQSFSAETSSIPGGSAAIFVILVVLLILLFHVILNLLLRGFRYVVGRTKTTLDDRIIKSTQPYLFPIAVFSAIWLGLEVAIPQGFSIGNFSIMDIYIIILLAIMSLMFSSLSDAFLLWYGLEIRSHKKKIRESEVYPFVRNVVKLAVLLLFLVFILQRMGFDTTAIITGLGIGGLAVALALQKTLENFFAGIHLLMDRPFRQYDYIKLESGQEGIVTEIGWRTTRLETVGKDEIVIPNSSLAGSIMTNFSSRMDKTGVLYELSVDYHEDANKVENLIISAINAVQKENEYVVPDTTWARLDSFGEYALNFKFGYLVKGYTNQWGVLREVNHQIFSIFKKNGVNMPLPVRRVIRKSALNKNKK